MNRVTGKVAFITGAGRGQGRTHATRLAEEGADIIATDICGTMDRVRYPLATAEDLTETARQVEAIGRRCVAMPADVRDIDALDAAARRGASELGGIDIVVANAGILQFRGADEDAPASSVPYWQDSIDVMLTGVFNTLRVVQDRLIEQGRGGSIIITSSTAGMKGMLDGGGGQAGYTAAKHGVVGLMRGYATLLGPHDVRVNTIHPTAVETDMITNEAFGEWAKDRNSLVSVATKVLPVGMLQPRDISEAVLWLASDEARYVTGVMLPVDAGVAIT